MSTHTNCSRVDDLSSTSEQRFISLVASVPVGIYRTDALGSCCYVNDRWCQIAGLTTTEAEGFGWINGLYPSDRELVTMEWNKALQENRPFQLEYRFQNKAGEITWVYGQAVAECDQSGEIIGYIGTITDISDRKATEQALKLQRDFNQLIAEISSRFIDISLDQLDAEIDRSLQLIGEATNSDTSYLIKFSFREQVDSPLPDGTVSMTNEWAKPEYPRQITLVQNVPFSAFPWANAKVLRREIVNMPRVSDAPIEAAIDKASWQRFNIVSALSVPIIQKSVVTGVMGFASFSKVVIWGEEIIRLLQVMAQTIANAQQRAQDEQQLYESEERLRLALRAANQGLYDLNLQTGEAITSPEYATMLGYNPSTFQETNAKWLERIHPDDCEQVAKVYQDYVAGILPEYKVAFRQLTQTGEWKWILSLGRIVAWDESGNPLRMLGTHTDISDRKQAEAERLIAEQVSQELSLLENIFDTLLAGYWDWDLQTNEEYLSPKFKKMFGYEDDELPNSPETWQHLIFDEDLAKVLDCFERHVQTHGEVPFCNEVRYRHKDGSTVWVICSGQVIKWGENDQPLRMIGCHVDISDRKQSEEKIRKSDAHLKTAQRIGKLGSWEFDPYSEQIIWSDEVFHIFGRDPAMGMPSFAEVQEQIHPDDREHHQQVLQTAAATVQPYDLEIRFYRCDGTLGYIQARGEPIVSTGTGQLTHLIGTVLDITDRKQAEAELQTLSDRLALAVKSGAIAIWDWNVPDNILVWDDRMYELYGITSTQFPSVYEAWVSSLHPDDRASAESAIQQALAGTNDYDPEFRVIHPDGTIRFLKAYALVQRDPQGKPLRMIGINLDITDRKQAEAQLMRTTLQLTASNRELEAFAYSVSHDLRSPLRAIDGFSKALLEDYGDKFDADAKDYFDRIRHNVSRMGMLIEDLLRLSRVSRSEMQYDKVNLSALVTEQLAELRTSEPERQVESVIASNVYVLADITLMRMVISNLIQNAWKFTSHHPSALIEFGVKPSESEQDGSFIYFIRDDGAGFDMNYANMLFGVFQRLHNTNEFVGTGIGLATVQRIIHRHGGRVWAEGAVEKGATVYFTIPEISSLKT
ncbi:MULTISPECIES: PAS domain-containing protein [Pseudanabaena]|uniref:PAS domain-containing protein n=1 Tax=Pseudanabaena TaxID=1152 RepID=UPI002479A351|nr:MULTISPECIES: PAS domain-containing protein [Pseudanabaena]MEA5489931.1 PAS domain-containing protein [Pseudanabaena sp. CCNP1317]WGS70891.1 PAS domain-containing protein [Pseudanabaena galeata CCNP1313]